MMNKYYIVDRVKTDNQKSRRLYRRRTRRVCAVFAATRLDLGDKLSEMFRDRRLRIH
jgi:hypothetical protein